MRKKGIVSVLVVMFIFNFISIANADLSDGLVAYYPFNGNANDESGNENNGTVKGAILTTDVSGNSDTAYSFMGSRDYISIPNNQSLNLSDSFSISVQVNLQSWSYGYYGDGGWIVSKMKAFDNKSYWTLQALNCTKNCTSSGPAYNYPRFLFSLAGQNGTTYSVTSNQTIGLNTNYIITIVGKDASLFMYINGKLDNTAVYSSPQKPNSYPVLIGTHYGMDDREINGNVDELRIYNRAISDSEIQELYEEKQPNEDSFSLYGVNALLDSIESKYNQYFTNGSATNIEGAGNELIFYRLYNNNCALGVYKGDLYYSFNNTLGKFSTVQEGMDFFCGGSCNSSRSCSSNNLKRSNKSSNSECLYAIDPISSTQ